MTLGRLFLFKGFFVSLVWRKGWLTSLRSNHSRWKLVFLTYVLLSWSERYWTKQQQKDKLVEESRKIKIPRTKLIKVPETWRKVSNCFQDCKDPSNKQKKRDLLADQCTHTPLGIISHRKENWHDWNVKISGMKLLFKDWWNLHKRTEKGSLHWK